MVAAVDPARVGAVEPFFAPRALARSRRVADRSRSRRATLPRLARRRALGVNDAVLRRVVLGQDRGAAVRVTHAVVAEVGHPLRLRWSAHRGRPSLLAARTRGVDGRRSQTSLGAMTESPLHTSMATCRRARPRRQGRKYRAQNVPARRQSPTDEDGQRRANRPAAAAAPNASCYRQVSPKPITAGTLREGALVGDDPKAVGAQLDVSGRLHRLRAGRVADRVKDYGVGRLCEAPGCSTRLSIYNPESRCALHEDSLVTRPPR
jgi:hypothetical protein